MAMIVKKKMEWIVADLFRKTYPEFPGGKLVASESPDFKVAVSPKADIGLELTRFVPDATGSYAFPDPAAARFLDRVREAVEARPYPSLWVKMLFTANGGPDEERGLSGISMTTAAIRRNINPDRHDLFTVSIPSGELPSFLSGIWIAGLGDSAGSVWEMADWPAKPTEVVEGLRQTIRRKEEKLPGYRTMKTREMWLLIIMDTLSAPGGRQVSYRIRDSEFRSGFDRVYVMGLMDARVIRMV